MATLIDRLMETTTEYAGEWYIAKPISSNGIFNKLKDAWGVLIGKYRAIYFYEDEVSSWGEIK